MSISGVTMIMPETSPCHHVHQFDRSCAAESWCPVVSATTATVAASVPLNPAAATKPSTSSPRLKVRKSPQKRLMRTAPTTASSVLPVPIMSAAAGEVSTVRFTTVAPSHTAGHSRLPKRSSAASAMPDEGQTGLA